MKILILSMTADRRSSIENSIENTRKYEKEDGEAGERDREREGERLTLR